MNKIWISKKDYVFHQNWNKERDIGVLKKGFWPKWLLNKIIKKTNKNNGR